MEENSLFSRHLCFFYIHKISNIIAFQSSEITSVIISKNVIVNILSLQFKVTNGFKIIKHEL